MNTTSIKQVVLCPRFVVKTTLPPKVTNPVPETPCSSILWLVCHYTTSLTHLIVILLQELLVVTDFVQEIRYLTASATHLQLLHNKWISQKLNNNVDHYTMFLYYLTC